MMPIFFLNNFKIRKTHRKGLCNKGFTLLEILVTIFLIGLTLSALSTGGFIGQRQFNKTINTLERSYRFAMDEAVLRNRTIRLHFYLDKTPQEYTIEYGPDAHFVVPSSVITQAERKSLQETERMQDDLKDINRLFTPVREFSEKNETIPDNILITGVGSSLNKALISEGEVSLYIYPNGEKDSGLIALSNDRDMAIMTTQTFTNDITIEQEPLALEPQQDPLERKFELTQELFDKWIKK